MRLLLLALALTPAGAQWQLQTSNTTAGLRGIHAVSDQIAWASGTNGTVLHTTDGGTSWLPCTTPPNAAQLDFRGIQAFDANTAIVMSSGKGDLSRLYKTTNACQSWHLVFTNPDKEGFWDAIAFSQDPGRTTERCFGEIVGDPVNSHFALFLSVDCGDSWQRQTRESPLALPGEALFAASNSSLSVRGPYERTFVTGGVGGGRELKLWVGEEDAPMESPDPLNVLPGARPFRFVSRGWEIAQFRSTPLIESSGAFSLALKGYPMWTQVIVGGDYKKPNQIVGTAWFQGKYLKWTAAQTPPHGYRSAVAYSPTHNAWVTVGPNGTDLSTDDGRNWQPLRPSTPDASPDEDRNWNALSLPFVVGPNGRIGRLRPNALP